MFLNTFKFGVEVPVFVVFLALMIGAPINSNFIIYRTCYVIMGKDEAACAQLGLNTTDNSTILLETEVQEVSNYIRITMELFNLIIPCVLCLFVGPYSDKKGRRNLLMLSLTGTVITSAIDVIVAMLPNISPWYLAVQILPTVLSGGLPTFITISFCYLIDVTNIENRTMRMGILEGAVGLGMIAGLFLSSYIFLWVNYVGTFLLCFGLHTFALAFTVMFVPESIITDKDAKIKFFTLVHIKEMWQTVFKSRYGYNRIVLLGNILAVVGLVTAGASDSTEGLLLRSKFHWDLEMITNFSSARSVIAIIGMCICIYVFYELMKISESVLIIIGLISNAIGSGMFALANYDWVIYTTVAVKLPAEIISPMIRSLVSKIIPHEDTGKIFSFCIAIETFCTIAAGPIYTIVYTLTIDVFPGAFDLIPVVIYVGIALFYLYIYLLLKKPDAIIIIDSSDQPVTIQLEKEIKT